MAIAAFLLFCAVLPGVDILPVLALNAANITTVAGNGNWGYSGDCGPIRVLIQKYERVGIS